MQLGLLVQEEKSSGGYYHMIGRFVSVEGETVKNISWDFGENNYEALADLEVYSQGNDDDETRRLYAWGELEYREPRRLGPHRLRTMAKCLDGINKRVEKINAEYGEPATFGQYCLRVAKAAGVQVMLVSKAKKARQSYDKRNWCPKTLAEGAQWIDYYVRQWAERLDEVTA